MSEPFKHKELIAGVFSETPDGVLIIDKNGHIEIANDQAEAIFGYHPQELRGQSHDILVPDSARSIHSRLMKGYFKNPDKRTMGQSLKFSLNGRKKDGSEIPIEISLGPMQTPEGMHVIAMIRDITDLKRLSNTLVENEKRYRQLFNSAPVALLEGDLSQLKNYMDHLKRDGISDLTDYFNERPEALVDCLSMVNIININTETGKTYGVKTAEDFDQNVSKFFSDPSLFGFKDFIINLATGRTSFQVETISKSMTGSSFPAILKTTIPEGFEENLSRILVSVSDITKMKNAEKILKEAEEQRFISLADAAPEAIITGSDRGLITYWNNGARNLFGYSEKEIIDHPITTLIPERLRAAYTKGIKRVVNTGKSKLEGQTVELIALNKDGTEFPIELSLAKWEAKGHLNFGAVIRDISERKQAEETIQHLADYDILTELPNRRLFSHLLDKTQAQMKRADKLLALLYLDLDGFKQVNDTFGHDVGDYLLTATASRISKQIRESDVAARVGGDEFNIALVDIGKRQNAARIAKAILEALAKPYHLKEIGGVRVSASIGIAIYPADSHKIETLTIKADAAMRHAKQNGGNTFTFFDKNVDLAA